LATFESAMMCYDMNSMKIFFNMLKCIFFAIQDKLFRAFSCSFFKIFLRIIKKRKFKQKYQKKERKRKKEKKKKIQNNKSKKKKRKN